MSNLFAVRALELKPTKQPGLYYRVVALSGTGQHYRGPATDAAFCENAGIVWVDSRLSNGAESTVRVIRLQSQHAAGQRLPATGVDRIRPLR